MASYYGSLSATRCLGTRRVPVIVADADAFAPARWSRHAAQLEATPPVRPIDPFIDWLLRFGDRHPGHVLYGTSDDLAWAFAERQAELRDRFRLLSPPFETVSRILDKAALYAACREVGLKVPRTWLPTDDEIDAVAREATFPVIVKPRTQVRFRSMCKGSVVSSPTELAATYRQFASDNGYDRDFAAKHPHLLRPLVQELQTGLIYAISGFCDPRRGVFVARGSRKLVQWPRRAGVGVAFEDAPVDAALAEGLRKLCETTGFFGVFEAEFVVSGDDDARLIDFNPRFFGQMGFDAARGLPSPYLVYLAATEAYERLAAEVDAALQWRPTGAMVYVNRTALAWTQTAELLVGRVPTTLPARVLQSLPAYVDAVGFNGDWRPAVVDGVGQILGALCHPRAALRAAFLGH
jgi:D-aspartate ligase